MLNCSVGTCPAPRGVCLELRLWSSARQTHIMWPRAEGFGSGLCGVLLRMPLQTCQRSVNIYMHLSRLVGKTGDEWGRLKRERERERKS